MSQSFQRLMENDTRKSWVEDWTTVLNSSSSPSLKVYTCPVECELCNLPCSLWAWWKDLDWPMRSEWHDSGPAEAEVSRSITCCLHPCDLPLREQVPSSPDKISWSGTWNIRRTQTPAWGIAAWLTHSFQMFAVVGWVFEWFFLLLSVIMAIVP